MATVHCPNCEATFEVDVRAKSATAFLRKVVFTFPDISMDHECPNHFYARLNDKASRKQPDDAKDTAVSRQIKL